MLPIPTPKPHLFVLVLLFFLTYTLAQIQHPQSLSIDYDPSSDPSSTQHLSQSKNLTIDNRTPPHSTSSPKQPSPHSTITSSFSSSSHSTLSASTSQLSQANNSTHPKNSEYHVLLEFFNSTQGHNWKQHCRGNWRQTKEHCSWEGLQCLGGRVVSLRLYSCGLSGTLPRSLGRLRHLQILNLKNNHLRGRIPPDLSASLKTLDLSDNSLDGPLPEELGHLPHLRNLDLSNNQFEGSLPKNITNLIQLTSLDLANNKFSGSLPMGLGQLISLQNIDISFNSFSGEVPSDFPSITQLSLSIIAFSSNKLSGRLSPTFFTSCIELTTFVASDNQFSGPFPFGKETACPKLAVLDVSNNSFSGRVFFHVYSAPALMFLRLSNNRFQGEIDAWQPAFDVMDQLVLIDLSNNEFQGSVPSVSHLRKLDYLLLKHNHMKPENWEECKSNVSACLPQFMRLNYDMRVQSPGNNFSCATVEGSDRAIDIQIDDSYFDYGNCRCSSQFHRTKKGCKSCLPNAYCPGGDYEDYMVAKPGYWGTPPDMPKRFIKCLDVGPNETACNPTQSLHPIHKCAEGYTGRQCAQCEEGYYQWGLRCAHCGSDSLFRWAVPAGALVCLIFFYLYLFKMGSEALGSAGILVFFLQVLNLLSDLGLPLPRALTSYYHSSAVINFQLPGGPECYVGWFSYYVKVLALMVVPAILMVVPWVVIYPAGRLYLWYQHNHRKCYKPNEYYRKLTRWFVLNLRSWLFVCDSFYLVMCYSVFRTFSCEDDPATGIAYLRAAPGFECSVTRNPHYALLLGSSLLLLVGYVLGVPLLFAVLLWLFQEDCVERNNPNVELLVGFLYWDYRPERYYWELVLLARKLLFAMTISLTSYDSYLLPVFVFMILVTSLLLHRQFQPFLNPADNAFEVVSSLLLIFNFYSALIYFVPTFSEEYSSKLGYFVLACNSFFVLILLCFLLRAILISLHIRLPSNWLSERFAPTRQEVDYVRFKQKAPNTPFDEEIAPPEEMSVSHESNDDGDATYKKIWRSSSATSTKETTENFSKTRVNFGENDATGLGASGDFRDFPQASDVELRAQPRTEIEEGGVRSWFLWLRGYSPFLDHERSAHPQHHEETDQDVQLQTFN
eukprot:TRINITY_DN4588_c0_g1_i1.p1 TRINITY_DN4588_c0_g1~~TRINITY_DN4588_c0_g1_i1.p1  ORF type:complete len:1118 (+),score=181.32 TRINITY_DN4588_c0_g1_i1:59-3412(+)